MARSVRNNKLEVIKALILMFNQRKKSHRFIVFAPTGTAAVLLNGSTYHSVIGIYSSKIKEEQGCTTKKWNCWDTRISRRWWLYIYWSNVYNCLSWAICNKLSTS